MILAVEFLDSKGQDRQRISISVEKSFTEKGSASTSDFMGTWSEKKFQKPVPYKWLILVLNK